MREFAIKNFNVQTEELLRDDVLLDHYNQPYAKVLSVGKDKETNGFDENLLKVVVRLKKDDTVDRSYYPITFNFAIQRRVVH